MSFGKKIFIMSFIIVILSIYSIGIMIISNNYKISMQEQIDKSIFQINTIYNNFILYENNKGMSVLANQYLQDKIHMEVNVGEDLIYSNIKGEATSIKEKLNANEENKIYMYIQNQMLYAMYKKKDVEIFTVTDISHINENRANQVTFFIRLTIFFSIMIAFVLSILVGFLTRKIKKLNQMASEIEKGNYEVTIAKLGKDEIGNLGRTFNNMATSIKNNVVQLNKTAEDREEFIHNLTHEIRTPLTSIIGYSGLMKEEKITDREKLQRYTQKIYKEGMYIKEITDKLMEIILLEGQEQKIEEINISKAMEEIVENLKNTYINVHLETYITPNVYAKADVILLQLLIINLVKNAIKAYETEPAVVQIVLKNNTIQIIDFGKGIKEEEKEKILEPFYTHEKDRNREFSGMGLGLPLCKKIIDIFKWKFYIKSKVNKGTRIIIEIGESHEEI